MVFESSEKHSVMFLIGIEILVSFCLVPFNLVYGTAISWFIRHEKFYPKITII